MAEESAFDIAIDLDQELLTFRDGFSVPILYMLDHAGFEVDDQHETVTIIVAMPPDNMIVYFDLRDIPESVPQPTLN